MEIVIIEKTAFDMLLAGVKALEDRVRKRAATAALPNGWTRRTCAVC